jgi:hypothetical protein
VWCAEAAGALEGAYEEDEGEGEEDEAADADAVAHQPAEISVERAFLETVGWGWLVCGGAGGGGGGAA